MSGLGWQLFQFVLCVLTCYRLQRVMTTDNWPPTMWWRDYVAARFGPESHTYTFFTCPWCIGSWITIATFVILSYASVVRLPVLQAGAAAALVGKLAIQDSD